VKRMMLSNEEILVEYLRLNSWLVVVVVLLHQQQ
jgi:hypothetical protein